jgi:hypothetical protein
MKGVKIATRTFSTCQNNGEKEMKDPIEQGIQAELENISKNIDTILNRIKNLDPVNQEENSEHKD